MLYANKKYFVGLFVGPCLPIGVDKSCLIVSFPLNSIFSVQSNKCHLTVPTIASPLRPFGYHIQYPQNPMSKLNINDDIFILAEGRLLELKHYPLLSPWPRRATYKMRCHHVHMPFGVIQTSPHPHPSMLTNKGNL